MTSLEGFSRFDCLQSSFWWEHDTPPDLDVDSHFFGLVEYLCQDDGDLTTASILQWLYDVSKEYSDDDADALIYALFTLDTEEATNIAAGINHLLPLIIQTPPLSDSPSTPCPPFLSSKQYIYNKVKINGTAVWGMLMGDVSELAQTELPWPLLFALHAYYGCHRESLKEQFWAFCEIEVIKNNKALREDPTFNLLSVVALGKGVTEVLTSLPPKLSYFMLNYFEVSDDIRNRVVDLSVEAYNSDDLWVIGALILAREEKHQELVEYLSRHVLPSNELEGIEQSLTSRIDARDLSEAKGLSCTDSITDELDGFQKLLNATAAIEWFLKAELNDKALDFFVNVFIRLVMEVGAGIGELDRFCNRLIQVYPDNEDLHVVHAFCAARNGFTLSDDVLSEIARILKAGWKTSLMQRMVMNVFIKQPRAAELFAGVEATPMDFLFSQGQLHK